jgi:ABC-type Fe3+ transport system permease subunit
MNWALLEKSLLVAVLATVLAVVAGLLAAVCLAGTAGPARRGLLLCLVVALAMPPFLVTNCWLDLLGATGWLHDWLPVNIYSLWGTVLVLALLFWPLSTVAILVSWERLEPGQLEAEPLLRGAALVRWLLWPMARDAAGIAGLLIFVLALNNFTVPAILQVRVLAAAMWVGFNTNLDSWAALAVGWPLVVAPLLVLPLLGRAREPRWPRLEGGARAQLFRRQIGPGWFLGCTLAAVILLGLSLVLPLGQLPAGGRTWLELWPAFAAGQSALANSAFYAATASTLTVSVGLSLAGGWTGRRRSARSWSAGVLSRFWPCWHTYPASQALRAAVSTPESGREPSATLARSLMGRTRRLSSDSQSSMQPWWRDNLRRAADGLLGALFWLPWFVPGIFLGMALIGAFNRPGLTWFYGSSGVVLLALIIRYLAPAWFGTGAALRSVDRDLIDAARLDGARSWGLFRHIVWPQVAPQVAATWYAVYLLTLWDVETQLLILPPGGETLASRIFNLLHYGHAGQVNALCVWLLVLALAPLAVWQVWRAVHRCLTSHSSGGETRGRTFAATDLTPDASSPSPAAAEVTRLILPAGTKPFLLPPRVGCCWLNRFLALLLAWGATGCRQADAPRQAVSQSRLFCEVRIIGSRGAGPGEFNKPRSVALDAEDNLYVADMTGRVQKFSPDGKYLLCWQLPETDLGKPKGMCRDRQGNLVVLEPHYQRVNHFTTQGRLAAQWGGHLTNSGPFSLPRAVAVNSRDEVVISEYTLAERVQVFAPRGGQCLLEFGRAGTGPGEFNRAEGVAVGPADRIYVADSCNHRVQVFAPDGRFLRAYGRAGTGPSEFSYPYDIQVDEAGRQYVCEFGNSRIQVFDANDRLIEVLGRAGGAPGEFANPWSLALDSQGNLYVADSQNHRVQKWVRRQALGQASDPKLSTSRDPEAGGLQR